MSNDNRSVTSNINPEFNPKSVNLTLNEKSVKRHIKRLGKVLQDNECIELKKSLSHTQLQEMFAGILGFNNYHELIEAVKTTQVGEGKEAVYQLNHLLPLMNKFLNKISHLVQLNTPEMTAIADFYNSKNKLK